MQTNTVVFLKKISVKLYTTETLSTLGTEKEEKGHDERKLPAEMGLSKGSCPLALFCPQHSPWNGSPNQTAYQCLQFKPIQFST